KMVTRRDRPGRLPAATRPSYPARRRRDRAGPPAGGGGRSSPGVIACRRHRGGRASRGSTGISLTGTNLTITVLSSTWLSPHPGPGRASFERRTARRPARAETREALAERPRRYEDRPRPPVPRAEAVPVPAADLRELPVEPVPRRAPERGRERGPALPQPRRHDLVGPAHAPAVRRHAPAGLAVADEALGHDGEPVALGQAE